MEDEQMVPSHTPASTSTAGGTTAATAAAAAAAAAGANTVTTPIAIPFHRAISPPTPAPSPQPDRPHGSRGSAAAAAAQSSTPSSSNGGSPIRASLSDGTPLSGQTFIKDLTMHFQSLPSQARLDLISALVTNCTKQELAHLSRIVSPRLRIDFLSELPIEISLHVLSFVDDPRTLARAACVCRFWRSLVNDEQTWMAMCIKHKYRTKNVLPRQREWKPRGTSGDAKGKGRLRDELEDLRNEQEEASILPSLYERYRTRGLDPSNAMQELRTLHALFLSKQEGNDGAVAMLSPHDAAFYAQLEDIVSEEIRDRYGKTRAELATPLHQRYGTGAPGGPDDHAAASRDGGSAWNVGRLSAGPPTSLAGLIGNVLSPSSSRTGAAGAVASAASTLHPGPRRSSTLPLSLGDGGRDGDRMDEDAPEGSSVVYPAAQDNPVSATSTSWWEGAAAAAAAAVAHTPVLAGGFAGGVGGGVQLTPRNAASHAGTNNAGYSFAAHTPLVSSMAASLLRTPNVRLPVSGIGNAFSHGLNALGLERNALLRFAGASPSQQVAAAAGLSSAGDKRSSPAIGYFDGETHSHSTTQVLPLSSRGDASSRRRGGRDHRRPRPQSALGLGIPSTLEGHARGPLDRAVTYSEGLAHSGSGSSNSSQPAISYKEQFKLAYQTESNWLRGGRLLSQYTCANDQTMVTSLAMDADRIVLGMPNCKIHVFDARTGLFMKTLTGHQSGVWCLSLIAGSGDSGGGSTATETKAGTGKGYVQQMFVTNPDDNCGRPYLAAGDGDLKLMHHDGRPTEGEGRTAPWPMPPGPPAEDPAALGHEETLQWFHRTRLAMLRREEAGNDMDTYEDGAPGWSSASDRSRAYSQGSSAQLNESFRWSGPPPSPGYSLFANNSNNNTAPGLAQSSPTGSVPSYGNIHPVIVSAGSDREIRVWDLNTGECKHVLRGHTATVRCLKVMPGRPIAISGARDHSVRVWDIEKGELIHLLSGHEHFVRCLDVAGNRIASGSYDATCRIWDVDTGKCLHVLTGHCHQIYSIAFDGEKVATGSLDATVRVWNAHTGECLALFQGHTSLVGQLQLTDKVLVTGGSDGRVIIFSLETYECLHRLCAHDNSVTCLQFDERFMVTGGNDGIVKLWDTNTGKFIRELGQPSEQVFKMAYRDDKCVIVCLRDGKPSMEIISFRPVAEAYEHYLHST
ncbi:hypothetical protein K437DRAFT_255245 [Tilletiaria anomala UBC 951]|uniref:F-box domain-containing protein n=1 Tax=Tilletiaria anomala (strain ATCC 24038 / CBS 436.72 / UBC 951) TaxID=1037660 RepID=A0A066WEQ2_TILAU|nr:uncharacterized protein K437DRAFT_255245 [Tilletiaria anomala UBC 951]KDN49569.1 hypothetical protein K437DRAFT_255245 [Tilletiaria anomala UBC 951]